MKKIYLLIILLMGTINAMAQVNMGVIEGKILSDKNKPLKDVEVMINTKTKAVSDVNGVFKFEIEAGEYILELHKSNLFMTTSAVNVLPHKTTVVHITFQEGSIALKEIVQMADKDLFRNSVHYAWKENRNIPGGNNLIDLADQNIRRSLTLKDALKNEPGIIIQEFFGGNDQPRLNIRGSGIQSNPQRRGINLLQDGIPFNSADGSYIISLLDPQVGNYIEVMRGSNGLEFGAANLGGALNIISKTGYSTDPFHIKIEAGSFDLYNISLEGGAVWGKADVYASAIKNHSNGFRIYNESSKTSANLNIGYKLNSKFQTRFYTQFINSSFDVSGPLNKKKMMEDPKQISEGIQPNNKTIGPNVKRDLPKRETQTIRVSNKSIYKINNNDVINLDLYYQNTDDDFYFPVVTGVRDSKHNDFGLNLKYTATYSHHHIKSGIRTSIGDIDRVYSANVKGEKGKPYADNLLEAHNLIFYAEDKYDFSPVFSGIAAIQLSSNHRTIKENFETPSKRPYFSFATNSYNYFDAPAITLEKSYFGFNPRIGFIYEPKKNIQYFLNGSRSYEPPTFDELLYTAGGNPNQGPKKIGAAFLDEQVATTVEFGSRGESSFVSWNISLYRSWVQNEILTTTDLFGISGRTRNSPDVTIHQGLEMGLALDILPVHRKEQLRWSIVYNYSDFSFNDGIYKGKQIAGIPEHYLTSNLDFKLPNGLFANINLEYLPSKTPTDHQNTIFQDSYSLWGAKAGYSKKNWSIYAQINNAFDKNYASSYLIRDVVTDPPPPSITPEDVTTFIPGVGRNLTIGINYNL